MTICCAVASSCTSSPMRRWLLSRNGCLRRLGLLLTLFGYLCAASGPAQSAAPLQLERVVLVMRHGVRPPTKDPAMPAGIAADPWPRWSITPGYLTAHGAAAVRLLGAADRDYWIAAGLLKRGGCPQAIALASDSDQRTIATGDAWAAGLAPGCAVANRHRPQDTPDPLFLNAGENGVAFDPARADAAVAEVLGAGGVAAAESTQQKLLSRLDRILCGSANAGCGVAQHPTGIVPAGADKRPKMKGALDQGSTAAQILLLEYAEGWPTAQVGWGRATAADITALSALHATEFAILARPPYLAAANAAPLVRQMLAALTDRAAAVTMLVGHDTNVASLAGMLDLHWQAPGFARDDPPPGGALLFELLRDKAGVHFVRASFRAQSLDQIRGLKRAAPYRVTMPIPGCAAPCPLARFTALVSERLPH